MGSLLQRGGIREDVQELLRSSNDASELLSGSKDLLGVDLKDSKDALRRASASGFKVDRFAWSVCFTVCVVLNMARRRAQSSERCSPFQWVLSQTIARAGLR